MVKETFDKPKKRGNPNPRQLPPGPGRPKGIPNKATIEFKQAVTDLLTLAAPDFQEWLVRVAATDPGKALDLCGKLAEYAYPKLNRTEHQSLDKNGKPADATTTVILAPEEAYFKMIGKK